jgi:hypothetical protein
MMLSSMRTTLSIDDDVLQAAKALAEQQRRSLGEVVSDLARRALTPRSVARPSRNGITLLPPSKEGVAVTPELVRQLRDDLP